MKTSRLITGLAAVALLLGGAYWMQPAATHAKSDSLNGVSFDASEPPDGGLGGPRNPNRDDAEEDGDKPKDSRKIRKQDGKKRRGFKRGERGEGDRRPARRRMRDRMEDGDRPPFGRGFDEPISPEMEAEILSVMEVELPVWHKRLSGLKARNPERYERAIRRIFPMMREYQRIREENPQFAAKVLREFEIEHDIRTKAEAFSKSKEGAPERDTLITEIRALLTEQEQIRLERHRFRIQEFERRLNREMERLEHEKARLAEEEARIAEEVDRKIEKLKKGDFRDELRPPKGPRRGMRPGGPRDGDDEFDGPRGRGGFRGRPPRFGDRPRDDRGEPGERPEDRPPPEDDEK